MTIEPTYKKLVIVFLGFTVIASCSKQSPVYDSTNENTASLVTIKSAEPEIENENAGRKQNITERKENVTESDLVGNFSSEDSSLENSVHRQLGAHVHGAASMNIVLENDQLTIAMSIPGMDAVGFEHAAVTAEEQTKLNDTLSYLQKPDAIFVLPADAKCHLLKGEVATALLNKNASASSHADVDINYQWLCKNTPVLKSIRVRLFSQFSHLQKIKANWVSKDKQGSVDLTPAGALLNVE